MEKKGIIAIIGVIVVIAVCIAVYFGIVNQPKKLNLEELNTKFAETAPFNDMMTSDIDNELLTSYLHVNTENVEQVIGKFPMMNVQASMYMIIKAKEGTVETVKSEVEQFGKDYEEQWSKYLPEQYELVKNRKLNTYGDYVYLLISENAETLESMIK